MPLSFGILFGLLITFVGVTLYFATRYKKLAKILIGIGAVISLITVGIIVLAMNSSM